MGGAYSNFELKIHIVRFILKIFKKCHENQRKKLILMKYVKNKSKFHAKTLLPQLQTYQSSVILSFHLRAIASLLGIDLIVWLSAMATHS
jgi:hypothetical protein